MGNKFIRLLLILIVISINIGCDQSTKYLARKHLKYAGKVEVIDNFVVLDYEENSGAFMGIFSGLPQAARVLLLMILPSIFLLFMLYYVIWKRELHALALFALCCIIGGGMSNVMIDRVLNDYRVVDFMNVGIGSIRSGIFNFADLSIMLGTSLLLIITLRFRKEIGY
jgi:signal peptidase II